MIGGSKASSSSPRRQSNAVSSSSSAQDLKETVAASVPTVMSPSKFCHFSQIREAPQYAKNCQYAKTFRNFTCEFEMFFSHKVTVYSEAAIMGGEQNKPILIERDKISDFGNSVRFAVL